MELRPEQIRALDYLRRKGTEAAPARVREQVAAAFRELEMLLPTLPERLRTVRPSPARWSVHEVLDHLVESHRPAVEQLRSLVAGLRPASRAIPPSLRSERPLERPWDVLVTDLAGIHRAFLAALDQAGDATSLQVTAPVAMVVKVTSENGALTPMTWEQECDWKAYAQGFRVHTVEHRRQMLSALQELEGPSYRRSLGPPIS